MLPAVSQGLSSPGQATDPDALCRLTPVGDCGLLVELGTRIDPRVQARVVHLDKALEAAGLAGVVEAIIGYTSLLVIFDPVVTEFAALAASVEALAAVPSTGWSRPRRWRVPVAYGGAFGLDIEESCQRLGVDSETLVTAHAAADYTIAMFGFLPGFAYLSGLPEHLALPRRVSPRARVFSGSIAIGGAQTAIGSIAGPCGWNVIGRTPLRTFDPERYPATIFDPGDEIRFVPISENDFGELAARADRGENLAEKVA